MHIIASRVCRSIRRTIVREQPQWISTSGTGSRQGSATTATRPLAAASVRQTRSARHRSPHPLRSRSEQLLRSSATRARSVQTSFARSWPFSARRRRPVRLHGGFTSEAGREARSQETRRLTLLGMEHLVDLWVEHYARLDEEDRQRLPLRRVYFLAPHEQGRRYGLRRMLSCPLRPGWSREPGLTSRAGPGPRG